jgi:hypothetical protein
LILTVAFPTIIAPLFQFIPGQKKVPAAYIEQTAEWVFFIQVTLLRPVDWIFLTHPACFQFQNSGIIF